MASEHKSVMEKLQYSDNFHTKEVVETGQKLTVLGLLCQTRLGSLECSILASSGAFLYSTNQRNDSEDKQGGLHAMQCLQATSEFRLL